MTLMSTYYIIGADNNFKGLLWEQPCVQNNI